MPVIQPKFNRLPKLQTQQFCHLANSRKTGSLVIAGLISLDLLRFHMEPLGQTLLRQAEGYSRPDKGFGQFFDRFDFQHFRTRGLQSFIFA